MLFYPLVHPFLHFSFIRSSLRLFFFHPSFVLSSPHQSVRQFIVLPFHWSVFFLLFTLFIPFTALGSYKFYFLYPSSLTKCIPTIQRDFLSQPQRQLPNKFEPLFSPVSNFTNFHQHERHSTHLRLFSFRESALLDWFCFFAFFCLKDLIQLLRPLLLSVVVFFFFYQKYKSIFRNEF